MESLGNGIEGDDFFFSAFGCGVQDCIDQTKETKASTKKIEERITQTEALTCTEENTAYQYGKDYAHLEDEMKRHRQVINDHLNDASMKEHMRKQLAHSFSAEFEQALNSKKSKNEEESTENEGEASADGTDSREGDFATEKWKEFEQLSVLIRTTAIEIDALAAQEAALMDQRTKLHTQMNAENLVDKLKTSKATVEQLTKELEEEQAREKTLRAAINEARRKTGAHAAAYVEKTTQRAELQKKYAAEEAKFKAESEAAARVLASEETKKNALRAKDETRSKEVESVKLQIVAFQKLREERTALVEKTNQLTRENETLEADVKLKSGDLAKKKDAATKASEGLQDAKNALVQAQARRSRNNEVHSKMKNDQTVNDALQKEKETLANSLQNSEASLQPEVEAHALQVKSRQAEIDKIDEEIEAHQQRIARLEEEWKEQRGVKEENRRSYESQVRETEQYKKNFEQAKDLETSRLEQTKDEMSERMQSTITKTKNEKIRLREDMKIKVEIFEEAVDAIEKAGGAERKVRAKEEKVKAM